jgi:hypothetical protein
MTRRDDQETSYRTRMPNLEDTGKRGAAELADDPTAIAGICLDISVAARAESLRLSVVEVQADYLGAEPYMVVWGQPFPQLLRMPFF